MFGDHKGHEVSPMEVSFEKLQGRIAESITSGFLSPKQINSSIFEIKHAAFLCVEEKEKLKSEIHRVFQRVRKACDEREAELQRTLEEATQHNIDKLAEVEEKWAQKYAVALEILYLLQLLENKKITSRDLVIGANALYAKLAFLEDPVQYKEVTALSGAEFKLDCSGAGTQDGLSHEALIERLKSFGNFRDSINICFKL